MWGIRVVMDEQDGKTKEPNKIEAELETYKDVKRVMEYLGRKHSDGKVRGDNLSKILKYLCYHKTEEYDKTVAKLAIICGMMKRYVRENYLDGLEAFGFIVVYFNSNKKCWNWVGLPEDMYIADFLK